MAYYSYNTPPLKEEEDNTVRFLFKDFYIENEIHIVNKIKNIADNKCFFYTYKKCNDIVSQTKSSKTRTLFIYDNNGVSMTPLLTYFKKIQNRRNYMHSMVYFYKHILKSLDLLVCNNILHNNICINNLIVCNEQVLLENFTVALDINKLHEESYLKSFITTYDPSNIEWSFEFHLISYLLHNNLNALSPIDIETVILDVQRYHILNDIDKQLLINFADETYAYYKKYINTSYLDIVEDIVKYFYTWDNYAFSILQLRIIISNKQTSFTNQFIYLLLENINSVPFKRNTIKQTDEKLVNILKTCNNI